ncbi:MAG: ADP-ribosylation factor-like protein [Promethearchaeota archaeon]|jgi:GTPase SAR1 family protein
MKVTLSMWDIAGQERFEFFKTDFFNGVAAVGLVFDLSRPDTFNNIYEYFDDIRERSGNIPIILVGNKNDLRKELGEIIASEKIIQMINRYNLFEYIQTSALDHQSAETLFYRLALTALLDFKPRLGEIVDSNHFRFKILLVGAAAVGKSSLINSFVMKKFEENYKLTVGLDFMIQSLEIENEDIPPETHNLIKNSIKVYKKKIKKTRN